MQTIKCLSENLIKTLSSIQDDNISIFDVAIERSLILSALKLLPKDASLTLNYGRLSWEDKIAKDNSTYKIDGELCIQLVSDRFTIRFLNKPKFKPNHERKVIPINFIEKYETAQPAGILINLQEFIEALSYALISIATDQSRPNLTCVLFESGNDTLKLVTADGFRLGVAPIKAIGITTDKILIYKSEIAKLLKFLKSLKPEGRGKNKTYPELYISYGDKLKFTSGNNAIELEITDRKITFPNYEQLIPATGTKVEFIASQFLQATKALTAIAKDGSNIIRCEFNHTYPTDKITLTAKSEELGESQVECDALVFADCKIAFNGGNLTAYLNHLKDSKVTAWIGQASDCAKFECNGKLELIMPMFVKWDDDKPAPIKQEPQDEVEEYIDAYPIEDTELVNA